MMNLTDCEQVVMKVIWDAGKDISLIQIMDALVRQYGKDWKRQTVSTFLVHLVQKGYLTSYRVGRVFYYHEEIRIADYLCELTKEYIDFWYDGSVDALVKSLE